MADEPFPVRWTGKQAVVVLPEQMDVSNAGQIRELLLVVINRGARALIVDMSATVSCDYAAADALARAHQRAVASGTELRLVVFSAVVRRALGLSGIDRLVPVYPFLEAAIATQPAVPARSAVPRAAAGEGWRGGAGTQVPHVRVSAAQRLSWPGVDSGVTDVGVESALLDRDGVIVSVNQAWLAFAEANGGDPARAGPGMSYLEVCAAARDDPAAQQVAEAIRVALAGDLPGPLIIEMPCHSPAAERWYEVLVSARPGSDGQNLGAAVTLSLARSRFRAQPPDPGAARLVPQPGQADLGGPTQRVPRPGTGDRADSAPDRSPAVVTPDVLMAMIEAISDGVALADIDGTLLLASRRLEEMFGYQHGELRGQPVEQLIPAYLQDVHRRHRASYDQAPAARPMDAGTRLVGLRKDRSTFPTEVSLSPVHTATGRFTLAVVRDVTATRRREDFAALAAAAVATRDIAFLDDITGKLHQVSLSLHSAAQLDEIASNQRIAEALSRLDDTIGEIRYAAFTSQDESPEMAGNNGKITKVTVRPGTGPNGTDSQADNWVGQAACSEPAGTAWPQ